MSDESAKTIAVVMGEAATEHFIATGKPARPSDIAARLGWPESKVRRHIRDERGFISGCVCIDVEVPTFSKAYRGMQHGVVRAAAWEPTQETLRRIIVEARKVAAKGEV